MRDVWECVLFKCAIQVFIQPYSIQANIIREYRIIWCHKFRMCAHLFLGFHRFRLTLCIFSNRSTSPQHSAHYRITKYHYHHRNAVCKCQKDDVVTEIVEKVKMEINNLQFQTQFHNMLWSNEWMESLYHSLFLSI